MSRAAALALFSAFCVVRAASAQLPTVRGYYLNVPVWSDSTDFAVGGFSDINRLRLMSQPAWGQLALDVAYEHVATYSERTQAASAGSVFGVVVAGGGEWVDLQWTLEESDHFLWRHRFDRLNLAWAPTNLLQVTVGRQTISWATTLILTPADPFVPFDPSDPFRAYRAGVDALRLQIFPSSLSDLDLVVRPAKTRAGDRVLDETLTLLARARSVWMGWEISGWAGVLHDAPAAAIAATGGLGRAAVRGEFSIREEDDDVVLRGTIGLDSRFGLFGRDSYVVLEYQHDDLAAASSDELLAVVLSRPFSRGELQVLGQDVAAGQAAYQLHPLLSTDLLLLVNLVDGSALLAPGASYSVSNEVTARAGVFLGVGDAGGAGGSLSSEYGIVPTIVYISLSAFF